MSNKVLLNNVDHHDLRLLPRHGVEHGDGINQVLVFPTEYDEIQREYPIFFRKDTNGAFQSVALLGLDRDENLFLDGHGWQARYVPAIQARGPFSITLQESLRGEPRREPMVHVDLDDPRVGRSEGEPLFLANGGNSPYLEHIAGVLRRIYTGLDIAGPMFAAFDALGLIQPVGVEIKLSDTRQIDLPNLYTIEQDRLAALDGGALERLHSTGYLRLAFLAAASLGNVARLIELKKPEERRAMNAPRKVQVLEGVEPDAIPFDELMGAQQPAILKGLARHWPLVRHGLGSADEAIAYLQSFDAGKAVVGYTGPPEIGGRFFYNEDFTALNFAAGRVPLTEFISRIQAHRDDPRAPAFYIGSTDVDVYLPGLRAENDLILNHPMFEHAPPLIGIWIGNRTLAAAHYDMSNNIACCMVGRRRFTLFPPDQVHNLYPGPLEPTPGGQVVSLVDFRAPDFDRFPRAREALAAAQVAEIEPGDILFYPALWWHQVEALDAFNVMINYWWNASPAFMDTPQNTLLHALLSLRNRPESEKRAWRELFEHYVFGPADAAAEHLPDQAQGALGPLDEAKARRLRAQLLNRLNR